MGYNFNRQVRTNREYIDKRSRYDGDITYGNSKDRYRYQEYQKSQKLMVMCIGITALFLFLTFVFWLCIIPTAIFGYLSYLTIKKSSQDRERALN